MKEIEEIAERLNLPIKIERTALFVDSGKVTEHELGFFEVVKGLDLALELSGPKLWVLAVVERVRK